MFIYFKILYYQYKYNMILGKNTVALITGGATGLGLATAKHLLSFQVQVIIVNRNAEVSKKLSEELKCSYFAADVSDENDVKQLFEFIKKKFGKLHLVLNCAAVVTFGSIRNLQTSKADVFETLLKINVIGTYNICKYAALMMSKQQMIQKQVGVIINVSSIAGYQGGRGLSMYSASKGAILGMTLPLARDLSKFGIRVMSISPGYFVTPLSSPSEDKSINNKIIQQTILKRPGRQIQFAKVVVSIFENKFAAGTDWIIDGGFRPGL